MTSPQPPQLYVALRVRAADLAIDWAGLEALTHLDPAGRGLASFRVERAPLDVGQLRAAALDLALRASHVAITTGFPIVTSTGIVAETDGPPGALFLARALLALGHEVVLIGDVYGAPLLRFGCRLWRLSEQRVVEMPLALVDDLPASAQANTAADRWVADFLASRPASGLTHLLAIERPGPSHTLESLSAQTTPGAAPTDRFAALVSPEHRGIAHNMRGESIQQHAAPVDRLFDWIASKHLPITTIGIGDGGNEIGMGSYAWETLTDAVGTEPAARIVCRTSTDYTLIAGVSNWAGYALALAVARLRDATDLGRSWNAAGQRTLIEGLVRETPAVDGLTRRREATVDGLPLDEYLRPLTAMRSLLGFSDSTG